MYLATISTTGFIVLFHDENFSKLLIFSFLFLISMSIRINVFYSMKNKRPAGKIFFILDIAFAYWISSFDESGIASIFFLIIILDSVMSYSKAFSFITLILCIMSSSFAIFNEYGNTEFITLLNPILTSSILMILIFATTHITKHQVEQKKALDAVAYEAKSKTIALEKAYNKLMETSEALEDMTILKERNRIAREIHDTVGHTLTTVLIEIEAGKRLMTRDTNRAFEKLELAQEQVRKGLNDIRQSVRTLKDGHDIMSFEDAVSLLISETEKHAEVSISQNINFKNKLSEQAQKTLYHALQEGLTNGIKHGLSDSFNVSILDNYSGVSFNLSDDGIGCDDITPSFGLLAMKDRVEALGGNISVQSKKDFGCKIDIFIPVIDEEGENTDD